MGLFSRYYFDLARQVWTQKHRDAGLQVNVSACCGCNDGLSHFLLRPIWFEREVVGNTVDKGKTYKRLFLSQLQDASLRRSGCALMNH
jgi:hypothetical protein